MSLSIVIRDTRRNPMWLSRVRGYNWQRGLVRPSVFGKRSDQGDLDACDPAANRAYRTDDRCHPICAYKPEGCAVWVGKCGKGVDVEASRLCLVERLGQNELVFDCATFGRNRRSLSEYRSFSPSSSVPEAVAGTASTGTVKSLYQRWKPAELVHLRN